LNSADSFRSSWLINEQSPSFDVIAKKSPSFSHLSQVPETKVKMEKEPPRVTSICLRYDDTKKSGGSSTTSIRPVALYQPADSRLQLPAFVSRSVANKDSQISSRVDLSRNGDRTWSFTKAPATETVLNKFSESDYLGLATQQASSASYRLQVRDPSPSRFSRNSQSPSKESLFLERTAERSVHYNENNRHMSSSPTSGTSKMMTLSGDLDLDLFPTTSRNTDKTNYLSKSFNSPKSVNLNNVLHTPKMKTEDNFIKKSETKKSTTEFRNKERKLSTSSSGRDGWLNAPKEAPVRKKSEPMIKKPENRKETKTVDKNSRINGSRSNHKRTESPIYQNREIYAERRDSNDNTETESTILEELTKAADQILLAVNGYTDDDSFRASSEDEYRRKKERISQPLCTISEMPTKKSNTNKTTKQTMGVIKSTRSTDLRKEYHSSSKARVGKTSSNSSMDSGASLDVKPLLSSEDRSKRRAARLLQRASSRELLFQTASSSEDIGSGSDTGSLRTKRFFRRPRLQNGKHTGSKQDLTTSASEPRTKERVQRTAVSGEVHKTSRTKSHTENRCSRHSKTTTGSSNPERTERRPAHSSRTQKKKPETSHLEAKKSSVACD